MVKVQLQYVTRPLGAWKWANTRGVYRVSLVDDVAPHKTAAQSGYLRTVWESSEVTNDYPGGRYGFEYALAMAETIARETAVEYGVPLTSA